MVSIIIPAYNAEKYIERCIKSVLSQSCSSFELIIINDGSTDSTDKICKKLCALHSNCYILEQTNMGVSVARNLGISRAKGEWIIFLDSDDYLEPNYVEIIEEYSSTTVNIDFMLFNYAISGRRRTQNRRDSGEKSIYKDNRLLVDGLMNSHSDLFQNTSLFTPWAKAYRSKIIQESSLYFENDVTRGEDMLFNLSGHLKK